MIKESSWTLNLSFVDDKVDYATHSMLFEGTLTLDPAKRFMDLSLGNQKVIRALYVLDGDKLTITTLSHLGWPDRNARQNPA